MTSKRFHKILEGMEEIQKQIPKMEDYETALVVSRIKNIFVEICDCGRVPWPDVVDDGELKVTYVTLDEIQRHLGYF